MAGGLLNVCHRQRGRGEGGQWLAVEGGRYHVQGSYNVVRAGGSMSRLIGLCKWKWVEEMRQQASKKAASKQGGRHSSSNIRLLVKRGACRSVVCCYFIHFHSRYRLIGLSQQRHCREYCTYSENP